MSDRWEVKFNDLDGELIHITMSSLATESAVRVYVGWEWDGDHATPIKGGAAHLNLEQAIKMRDALDEWIGWETEVTPTTVERCTRCGHAPHETLGFCPNMASDNDCECTKGVPL